MWKKSTFSGMSGCVEVDTELDGVVGVRQSRTPDGPVLVFTVEEWESFTKGVRAGEFDK